MQTETGPNRPVFVCTCQYWYNKSMKLSYKHQAFIDSYFLHNQNATEAYCDVYGVDRVTGAVNGCKLLRNAKIVEQVKKRIAENTAGADEVLMTLTEIERASIGMFFKLVEEWTYYPLPSYEIIDAKEVKILDEEGEPTGEIKISYWVRHIALDMDKLLDPKYGRLVSEFSDSPRNGLKIKMYSRHEAARDLGRVHALFTDKVKVETWQSEIVDLLRSGSISPEEVKAEVDSDLAEQLFREAGIEIDEE